MDESNRRKHHSYRTIMDKYVRVDWPESQEWLDDKYEDVVWYFENTAFVPEELYNRVKGE